MSERALFSYCFFIRQTVSSDGSVAEFWELGEEWARRHLDDDIRVHESLGEGPRRVCSRPCSDSMRTISSRGHNAPPTSAQCGPPAVSKPDETHLEAIYRNCEGFIVNATYEIAPGWAFVKKSLSICLQDGTSQACPG